MSLPSIFTRISLLVLFLYPLLILSSSGDRLPAYQSCLSRCVTIVCDADPPPVFPLALRLTWWTCKDDCSYRCMQDITDMAISSPSSASPHLERIHQYHGKWPFHRLIFIQEPASVLFSLLNLYVQLCGMRLVRRRLPPGNPMRGYYLAWAAVSVNAWVWSSVFHIRDLSFTERMDYFSAALAILYALYYTVIRLFRLYSPSSPRILRTMWTIICITLYVGHITYLSSLPRFDYTYNIIFNLAIGVTHNLLWLFSSLPLPHHLSPFPLSSFSKLKSQTNHPHYRPFLWQPPVFILLTTLATLLELLDFPPWWRVIDAHSLWHLSTVPLGWFWWSYLVEDAVSEDDNEGDRSAGKRKGKM